jgi:hypothetical protein
MQQRARALAEQHAGFGLNEFVRSLGYPLTDIVALVLAATFYGFIQMIPHVYATVISVGFVFACMSHVINRVSMGRADGGFMPDFSDSLSDTLVAPVKLGVAVTIITIGPLVALMYFLGTSAPEGVGMLVGLGIGALVGGAWALFYYPMALLVAGFTQSFWAVVNPLVGLDTMWRMGLTYVKAYLMCLVVGVVYFICSAVVTAATMTDGTSVAHLGLRFLGNLVEGGVTFYFSLVVACILGFALYRCADALDIGFRN